MSTTSAQPKSDWDAITTPPSKKVSNDPKDIADILSGYKQPMEVVIEDDAPKESPVDTGEIGEVIDKSTHYVRGPKKGQRKPQGMSVSYKKTDEPGTISGELIPGIMFITLIDMLLPLIITILNNRFSKTKMKAEVLQLEEKQKKMLEPLADKVVAQIQLSGNPTTIFFFMLVGCYGMNYMAFKMDEK